MLRILIPSCLFAALVITPILGLAAENGTCGRNGNADNVCSPHANDHWTENADPYLAEWNHEYPTYASSDALSIYIFFIEQFEKKSVIAFHNISNTGQFPIRVNRTWFSPALGLNTTGGNHDALFYILESGINPFKEMNNLKSVWPSPILFTVTENNTADATPNRPTAVPLAPGFSVWLIPVIAIGSVILFILLCFAVLAFYRYYKAKNRIYQNEKGAMDDNYSCNTIYPRSSGQLPFKHDPQVTYSSSIQDMPVAYQPPKAIQSMSNISCRSDPPLTSNDALLIGDTFRQRMRRPEWPHCSDVVQPNDTTDDDNVKKTVKEDEEEMQRRLASELLLKKELEAEGTLMKQVGKRPHLLSTVQFDPPSST
ncbi:hypothetical protein BC940DRAFT_364081 [Gongronella butleri]|nr:hypothetical protein BC940DRAFT_364081 [Gongronella butleri]